MTTTATFTLNHPDGSYTFEVTWNGYIKDYWKGDHLQPTYRYLFEASEDEREERLAALREALA